MRNLLLLQHAVEKRVKRFLSIFRRPCIQHTEAWLEGVEGHFPVFVVDDGEPKKFIVPLRYLGHPPFLRLMEAAAEEFGFDQPGVLLIPCRAREIQIAVRIEDLSGFNGSLFCPYLLPQVSLGDPIEKYMTPFKEANPLQASLDLKKAVMRFYRDAAVPVVDDWGSCVGIVHREDCNQGLVIYFGLTSNTQQQKQAVLPLSLVLKGTTLSVSRLSQDHQAYS